MLRVEQSHAAYGRIIAKLVGDRACEQPASARATGIDIATATFCGHTGAEADLADTANLGRLVCWLHDLNVLKCGKATYSIVQGRFVKI